MEIKNVVVIGSGTMGSGIAAHLCNANIPVTLLDLTTEISKNARDRIFKSRPPLLLDKTKIDNIAVGNIEENFDVVKNADWIVEAVVERIDIKHQIYEKIFNSRKSGAIVSSNTSSIPIKVLSEKLSEDEKKDFCITHFFNPVRYMGLLEIVKNENNDLNKINALKLFCEKELGKGAIVCNDTPGFLGNRVGVYAMQVAMSEAFKMKLSIEEADAIFGRPMGIPKTGVFGLYDLIGIDLMVDVVASLRDILPEGDAFHALGGQNDMIMAMIADGFTGDKGRGGFYMTGDDGAEMARPLTGAGTPLAAPRARDKSLPDAAMRAAEASATRGEPLHEIIDSNDECARFCRRVLGRILAYAASLVPDVTESPQDIDDAMKLGFNWQRGPFEMIDAIGQQRFAALLDECDLTMPAFLEGGAPNYSVQAGSLMVRHADGARQPVNLPEGVMRFHMTRRTLNPILTNDAASLFALDGNLRLVEFHSKANALTDASMEIVAAAAKDHGAGIIIHNDAQHFSAGVDLNAFRRMIEAGQWNEIDSFLLRFQTAVAALKYAPVPVVGAPSGLAAGGGFEVLAHCDKLVVHTNSVLGLVEAAVGVVPSGGGVKESYLRWHAHLGDWEQAAWKAWMNLGYAATGSSPELASRMQYFRQDHDETVMNRDRLLPRAIQLVTEMAASYTPPKPPKAELAPAALAEKMAGFMQDGVDRGDFMPHDKTVAMQIATIMVQSPDEDSPIDEDGLFARERDAFIRLAKTPETHARISAMLDDGAPVRN